jgi:uncharacterized protein (TIGR02145 family)
MQEMAKNTAGCWHLPSKDEWEILSNSADGNKTDGKHLKAASGWNENGNGQDSFGFSALPGGFGYSNGSFNYAGYNGYWWSGSEYDSDSEIQLRHFHVILPKPPIVFGLVEISPLL